MNVYGVPISKDTIDSAIKSLSKKSFTATALKDKLEELNVPCYVGVNYISINAASRIIKDLKKKGMIFSTYGGGPNTLWNWKDETGVKKSRSKVKEGATKQSRGKYVTRAAFAKLQAEKQRLEKDIYAIVMGSKEAAVPVLERWKIKFEKEKVFNQMLRELLSQGKLKKE